MKKRNVGVIFVFLGLALIGVSSWSYFHASRPNPCVVDFMKSLGGQDSFQYEQSMNEKKQYAVLGLVAGGIFLGVGGFLTSRSLK